MTCLRILATIAVVSIAIHYTTSYVLQMFHNHNANEEGNDGSYYLRRGGIGFLPAAASTNNDSRHLVPVDDLFFKEEEDEEDYSDPTSLQQRRRLVPVDEDSSTPQQLQQQQQRAEMVVTTATTSCRCSCKLAETGEEGWAIISYDDELVEGVLGGDPSLCIPKHELKALVETGKGVCDDLCTITDIMMVPPAPRPKKVDENGKGQGDDSDQGDHQDEDGRT